MANFNDIKHEIDQNVNTNGVQAITGAILNETLKDMIDEVDAKKQDTLIAGQNITIQGNVISATGGGSGTTYTAGDGIDISSGNVISVDPYDLDGNGLFVDAEGDLAVNPSDIAGTGLTDEGSGRLAIDPTVVQGKLTPGANIQISGNTISATDTNTTYSAGSGLSLNGTTFSVKAGSGLGFDANGNLINTGGGGGGTTYTAGDGIEIDSSNVINAKLGNGLQLDQNNSIEIDPSVVASQSDIPSPGFGLQVSAGNEIYVDTTQIQEKLTAGQNITISGNVISSTGGGQSYSAGQGIDINNNVISVDASDLAGNGLQVNQSGYLEPDFNVVASQSDLLGKQDTLVAGANITINGNTISATDTNTTYSAGSGLNLNGTTFSVDTSAIQEKLTAGTGISINGTTISATGGGGSGLWVNGTGTNSLMAPATAASANTDASGEGALNAGIDDDHVPGAIRGSYAGGDYSASFGFANQALGDYSAAFGASNTASGMSSFAIGGGNSAVGDGSFAGGNLSTANGRNNLAFNGTTASGVNNIAINGRVYAGDNNVALGGNVSLPGGQYNVSSAVALGGGTAVADNSLALGGETNGENSTALGKHSHTSNENEIGMGYYNKTYTSGNNDTSVDTMFTLGNGEYNVGTGTATQKNAIEVKKNNDLYISGVGGFTGANSGSSDTLQTVLAGKQDTLTAGSGISIQNNVISATGGGGGTSFTPGDGLELDGNDNLNVLYGPGLTVNGNNELEVDPSSITGFLPLAGGMLQEDPNNSGTTELYIQTPESNGSIIIDATDTDPNLGESQVHIDMSDSNGSVYIYTNGISDGTYTASWPTLSGDDTIALLSDIPAGLWEEGSGSGSIKNIDAASANGNRAFVAGYNAHADGDYSVALGARANASYANAFAIGADAAASQGHAFAIGKDANSSASYAFAIGRDANSSASYAYAIGRGVQATNQNEVGLGVYNKSTTGSTSDDNSKFTIGNGTGNAARSNVLEIKENGDAYLYGVGGFTGANTSAATTLQDVINNGGGGSSYSAGSGIDITNNTISVDTTTIQEKLTAGSNITISGNVISATGGGASYSAGTGIDITNNTISVDNTIATVSDLGGYLPLTGGTLQANPSDAETLLDVAAPDSTSSISMSADYLVSEIELSSDISDSSIQDGDIYKVALKNTGEISVLSKTVNPLDPTDITPTAYTLVLPQKNDTIATLSDIQGGGSSYSAGAGINIDANNVISNTAPDPGLWVAGTGAGSIRTFTSSSGSAGGLNSIAIGDNTVADGGYSTAIGSSSRVYGSNLYATAIAGGQVGTFGSYGYQHAVAIGNGSYCTAADTIALGVGTRSFNQGEASIGYYANAITGGTTAENTRFTVGNGTGNGARSNLIEAKQNNDLYIYGVGGFTGTNASSASTLQAVLSGKQDTLTAGSGITITNNVISATGGGGGGSLWTNGTGTDSLVAPATITAGLAVDPAQGTGAISCGYDTNADGDYAFAQGGQSSASGNYSFAANNSTAAGNYSAAFGAAGANGTNSFAAVSGSADADYSVALAGGQVVYDDTDPNDIKNAQYGVAIGDGSVVEGEYGLAMSGGAASGSHSVAIGDAASASEMYSTAFAGSGASGNYSFAASTGQAGGHYSSAFGGGNAVGEGSLASGFSTSAHGYCSAALGYALSTYSQADGALNTDPNAGEVALGRYNYSESGIVFTVGCGYLDETDPDNPTEVRQNAVAIDSTGKIYLKGLGGYTGTSTSGCTDLASFLSNL